MLVDVEDCIGGLEEGEIDLMADLVWKTKERWLI